MVGVEFKPANLKCTWWLQTEGNFLPVLGSTIFNGTTHGCASLQRPYLGHIDFLLVFQVCCYESNWYFLFSSVCLVFSMGVSLTADLPPAQYLS